MLLADDNKRVFTHFSFLLFAFACLFLSLAAHSATPGLPFSEDFTDINLKDGSNTDANWSTQKESVLLAFRKAKSNALSAETTTIVDLTEDIASTASIAVGDVDGDGDIDIVALDGNTSKPSKLYLNNGTSEPFSNVSGTDVAASTIYASAVELGDINGDGRLDLIVASGGGGASEKINDLYLNNGSSNPFSGVTPLDIGTDGDESKDILVADINDDGRLDIIAANRYATNKLYLNDGDDDPFNGDIGIEISSDADWTGGINIGDIDLDGDLDVIAANFNTNSKFYLNNSPAQAFNSATVGFELPVSGSSFSTSVGDLNNDGFPDIMLGRQGNERYYLHDTSSSSNPYSTLSGEITASSGGETYDVPLVDIDSDGDLDLLVPNTWGRNELFLNNGSADPFDGVAVTFLSETHNDTRSMLAVDIDSDGDIDVIEGNTGTNRLYINNAGTNPFAVTNAQQVTSDGDTTKRIVVTDMNHDGFLDIIAVNSGITRLYQNNKTNNPFDAVVGQDINNSYISTNAVAVGDINRDGNKDIVLLDLGGPNLLYLSNYTNSPATPFSGVTPTNITSDNQQSRAVRLGDVNRDGWLDIIVANGGSGDSHNRLYLNDGVGDPFDTVSGINIGEEAIYTHSIELGDVDGDGDLDVIAGHNNVNKKLYLFDETASTLEEAYSVGVDIVDNNGSTDDSTITMDMVLCDIDNDGDVDLVTAELDTRNRIYFNDRTGNPFDQYAIDVSNDSLKTYGIRIGDVDNDGDLDIVTTDSGTPNNLYTNDGNIFDSSMGSLRPTFTASKITTENSASQGVALQDIDNDGDLDLLEANYNSPNNWFPNQSAPYPYIGIETIDFYTSVLNSYGIAVADLNRDGFDDIVTANYSAANSVFLNSGGAEAFDSVTPSIYDTDSLQTYDVTIADINADGKPDIINSNNADFNRIYLNDGAGDPFDEANIDSFGGEADSSRGIAVADVNLDGYLDVLVTNYGANNIYYINSGNKETPLSTGTTGIIDSNDSHNSQDIKVADFNLDGYPDVAVANNGVNRVYLHNHTATAYSSASGQNISTENHNTLSIAVGDVNRDGLIDVVAGNNGDKNGLYLNNGTSTPFSTSVQDIGSDTDATHSILLTDIDHDGDLDVITGNDGVNKYYLNNGSATPFSGVVAVALDDINRVSRSIVTSDVDNDGNIDILAANDNANNTLTRSRPYDVGKGRVASLDVDADSDILMATLTPDQNLPHNTSIDWFLSNDGGTEFFLVTPGVEFVFPAPGDELRWKAVLHSRSPLLSPRIDQVDITARFDHDHDLVADDVDNCIAVYNPLPQVDTDGDGAGDVCDADDDNDGVSDINDAFPLNPTATTDTDSDGIADSCLPAPEWFDGIACTIPDDDDDNDGIPDGEDTYSTNHRPTITGTAAATATPDQEYSFILTIDDGYEQPGYPDPLIVTSPNIPTWLSLVKVDEAHYKVVGVPSNDDYGSYSNIDFVVSDGEEESVLTVSSISVPDTRAPTTFAVPGTGNYNADADVSLACFEDIGSGCSVIHYKLDSDTGWSTHNGNNTRIVIPASLGSATLQFYSNDAAGNTETSNSETYTFDTIAPEVTIDTPTQNDLLATLADITGTSSDSGTGINKVELQISGDNNTHIDPSGSWVSGPAGSSDWVLASSGNDWIDWSYDTSAIGYWSHDTRYTIIARAIDNAGNITSTTHTFRYYDGDPAFTTLNLNLSSSSVIYGGEVDASFKLTELGDPDADLSGSELTLLITDPDYDENAEINPGKQYLVGPFFTNSDGQVTITGLGRQGNGLLPDGDDSDSDPDDLLFNKKGTWTLQAQYAGSLALAEADSQPEILLVGTSAGYAVIVEGKADNNEGLESHHKTGKRIYQTLLDRGFAEQNIFYFSYYYNDPDLALSDANDDGTPDRLQLGVGMDGLPSKAGIQSVLQEQLAPLVAFNPAPIYLVMVDHGTSDHRFLLGSEDISPADLDNWLTDLESDLNILEPDALIEPRAVILGYCYSGGFVDELSAANRLIITSAAANEESYKGPLESDGVRVGEFFLEELFQALGKGSTFQQAFIDATEKTETYTRSGGESANSENAYLDDAQQHPLLDDDGNGQGSNVLDVGSEDGQLASQLVLGTGPNYDTNSLENPAEVVEVTSTGFLNNSDDSAELWLKANDNGQVSQAYVEIRDPQTTLASGGTGTEQLTAGFTKRILLVPGQNDGSGTNPYQDRFYLDTDGFIEPGKYEVFYYVEDVESGNISPAKRSVVYKNKGANNAPTHTAGDANSTWELISPADTSTTKTVAILDWEDAQDPDADDLSYTVEIADSNNFDPQTATFNGQSGPYSIEELTASQAVLDASAGLQDQQTYYWRVKAIDVYGATTISSQVWSFSTNNNNAPYGILKGIVYSDQNFSRLAAASVFGQVGAVSDTVFTATNGEYLILLPPGLASLNASNTGFVPSTLSNIDIPVSTALEPYVELNIAMQPDVDTDGDGVYDSQDAFVDNDAASTDTDGDGQPDDWNVGCDATCQSSSGLTLDLDDDNDGMSDEYENANGLDPLVDDASGDLDNDGYTNFEEFEAGTAANDANDTPRKSSVILKILPLILDQ